MSKQDLTLFSRLMEEDVWLGLEADERDEVLTFLARQAERRGLVPDHRSFLEQLKVREAEMSTGVGRGLAVPHAEAAGAERTFVVAATLRRPINYHAIDDQPADVIFLIGGKPGETGLHLQLLARIARLARQPEFLERLRAQTTAGGFLTVVEEAEQRLYPAE